MFREDGHRFTSDFKYMAAFRKKRESFLQQRTGNSFQMGWRRKCPRNTHQIGSWSVRFSMAEEAKLRDPR